MKPEMKKLIIANLPYLLFVYLFGKLGQAYRLAEGIDLSQKLLHFADGCAAAFESAAVCHCFLFSFLRLPFIFYLLMVLNFF